jgi:hypothetical protein
MINLLIIEQTGAQRMILELPGTHYEELLRHLLGMIFAK